MKAQRMSRSGHRILGIPALRVILLLSIANQVREHAMKNEISSKLETPK